MPPFVDNIVVWNDRYDEPNLKANGIRPGAVQRCNGMTPSDCDFIDIPPRDQLSISL